jgi:hypothetical protein
MSYNSFKETIVLMQKVIENEKVPPRRGVSTAANLLVTIWLKQEISRILKKMSFTRRKMECFSNTFRMGVST